ncbi:3-oxoadipate CoA-transferase subunit B [Pseudovibrio sp. Ad26]|nr:3-oxoadipate CoA-transferase subunit B [Pseudovibrio sp. Ad26]
MNMEQQTYTTADVMICAAAKAWEKDGELLANGIGSLPRIAAGLAKLTLNDQLMLSDGEAFLVEEPVPLGCPEEERPNPSGWLPYTRVFDVLWSGRRHAMVSPVQIDQYGQANISCLGDFKKPKVQMLGARGFPGNSIHHCNSMLVTRHDTKTFVKGEVDVVCSAGYNPRMWPDEIIPETLQIGLIVTPLCVMDFNGDDHKPRVVSLHAGVSLDQVRDNTGYDLQADDKPAQTETPNAAQMAIIKKLDPNGIRLSAVKQ